MVNEIRLPEISENIASGDVVRILVQEGMRIEKDQPIVELETEKASFEVPSPQAGKVIQLMVKEGDTVKIGQPLIKIEPAEKTHEHEQPHRRPPQESDVSSAEEKPVPQKSKPEKNNQNNEPPQQYPPSTREKMVPVPAAPSVRREARELGVDITQVKGSGPDGLITSEDVTKFAHHLITSPSPSADTSRTAQPPLPDFNQWGDVERIPMTKVRKITAESTHASWITIPHVTQFDKTSVTELERFRKQYNPYVQKHGAKLTITALLVKVVASALQRFPQFNTSVDMERKEIIQKKYIHIGIATDTDRGLLVPVLRNADQKSVVTISQQLTDLTQRARNKQLNPDEMKGGTFTISNLGGIGGTQFTPIIYYPQVAILGTSRIYEEPVFSNQTLSSQLTLPLSLSYDHRVIDGADGARFLRWIAEALENPFLLEFDEGRKQ